LKRFKSGRCRANQIEILENAPAEFESTAAHKLN
jgi:hypothetical protein